MLPYRNRRQEDIDWNNAYGNYEIDITDPKNKSAAVAAAVAINCGIEGAMFMKRSSEE